MSKRPREASASPPAGNDSGGAAAPPLPAEPTPPPALEALVDVVEKTYRALSDDERERIRTVITASHQAAAAMAAYQLTNADEPDTTFTVYRAD
jgi:hypothetical protein